MRDDLRQDQALKEAKAFASAYMPDKGNSVVAEKAAALPADMLKAWGQTREAAASSWEEMVLHVITFTDHLRAGTATSVEAQEACLLFGYYFQAGLTSVGAFSTRFGEEVAASLGCPLPDDPPPRVVH